ncbi:hypothetical protein [Aestuariimicrobium ganziense]|uniref:hypothetical protein n=1 Tax=Aestuariimicrobium ganziense TaxID=2773677 RepID=UPI0019447883|nr:hypothetical protein [Aestuariimicrobium ganziense]
MTGRAAATGLVTTPLLQAISRRVAASEVADVNTAFTITQRVTASLGIAALGTIFSEAALRGDPALGLRRAAFAMSVLALACLPLAWAVRSGEAPVGVASS